MRHFILCLSLLFSLALCYAEDHVPADPESPETRPPAKEIPAWACENPSRYACQDMALQDGTGTSYSATMFPEPYLKIKKDAEPLFRQKFKERVKVLSFRTKYLGVIKKIAAESQRIYELPSADEYFMGDGKKVSIKPCHDKPESEACSNIIVDILSHEGPISLFSYADRTFSKEKRDRNSSISFNQFGMEVDFLAERRANFSEFHEIMGEVFKEVSPQFKPSEEYRERTEKLFSEVVGYLKEVVNEKILNENDRKRFLERLDTVKFDGSDCNFDGLLGDAGVASKVRNLVGQNAYYTPIEHKFRFCNGLSLRNTSLFSAAAVMGHEIAHSFDPCRIGLPAPMDEKFKFEENMKADNFFYKGVERKDMEDRYPIPGLLKCLRSKESVAAKNFARGSDATEPYFCFSDQITESVADWFGAEAMVRFAKKHYSSGLSQEQRLNAMVSPLRNFGCESSFTDFSFGGEDVHPRVEDRLDKIFFANPGVREFAGCPASKDTPPHCGGGTKP